MPVDFATLQRLARPLPPEGYAQLTCPTCAYDVRQTLIDRFDRCPECGTQISVRACKPKPWDDSPRAIAFMFLIFFLPTLAIIGAAAFKNSSIGAALFLPTWFHVAAPLALSYAAILFAYRHSRRRMGESPSWLRSALDALAVLLLNFALWLILLPILFVIF